MGRLISLGDYERIVVLVLFLSLGVTIGMLWAHNSCISVSNADVPTPRRAAPGASGGAKSNAPRALAGDGSDSTNREAEPADEEELHDRPNEDVLQAIEALQLIQQRHHGPDDDDAVASVIARELLRRRGRDAPRQQQQQPSQQQEQQRQEQHGESVVGVKVNHLPPPRPQHLHQHDGANGNTNHKGGQQGAAGGGASDHAAAQESPANPKRNGPTMSPAMRDMIQKLGLDGKVDMEQLLAQGQAGDEKAGQFNFQSAGGKTGQEKHQPVPAYLMNTMPDEPPYGTPPDPNPKKDAKIFALVLTMPHRHDPKAIAVNSTWGQRLDGHAFMTSGHHRGLNTVIIPIKDEERKDLWLKTRLSLLYAYTHHLDKYDWFMKLDDDAYVMVDNLRDFLSNYDPERPHFFGRRFLLHRGKKEYEMSYHSGGAGYVLSRKALKLLGDNADTVFRKNGVAEDVEIARSLAKLGIQCEDTRDETGRERFLPLNVQRLRYDITKQQKPNFWYWRYTYYPARDELGCCSTRWITTHYVYSKDMYTLDRLHKEGMEAAGKDPQKREW